MLSLTLTRDPTEPTPIENRDGRWYKREDLLAFSNGVNGKVRTSLWLAWYAKDHGYSGLVYGGSVHAPALGRVASAAAYGDLDCYLVVGSNPDSAVRHDTVRVAVEAGASLVRSPVAYNPALQRKAADIASSSNGYLFQVPYGVSTPEQWPPSMVRAFLQQDAEQVESLPEQVETLVLPFGSGNAAAGVFYGLSTRGWPPALERIVLVGVGPDRLPWLRDRLGYVGIDLDDFPPITHLPLHPHFAVYNDRMPETVDGINFHPTYEGKVVRYLNSTAPDWWVRRDGTTCLWIVGGP